MGSQPLVLPVLLVLQRDLTTHQGDEDVEVLLAVAATWGLDCLASYLDTPGGRVAPS